MIEYPLKKLGDFFKGPVQDAPVGVNLEAEKRVYKRYARILYFDYAISKRSESLDIAFERECVADLSAAYIQFFMNLNKPSLMSLRSALENSWRFVLDANGVNSREYDTVTGLVSEARGRNLYSGISTKYVNKGYDLYKDLCQAVHSSKADYLNKDIPFRSLTGYSKKIANQNLKKCESVFSNVLTLLFIAKPDVIKALESKERDFILDGIPRDVKRAVSL